MNIDLVITHGCRLAAGAMAIATILLLILLGLDAVHAADPDTADLTVVIDDVRSGDGVLRVQILAVTEDGAEGEPVAALILPPASPETRATLHGFPRGRYLARVHHDVDGDEEMATNLVGMPQEPWGVSNDARGRFGPPAVKDMIMTLGVEGAALRMTLVH